MTPAPLHAPAGARVRVTGYIGSTFYGWDGYGNYVHVVVREARTESALKQALCYAKVLDYTVPFS